MYTSSIGHSTKLSIYPSIQSTQPSNINRLYLTSLGIYLNHKKVNKITYKLKYLPGKADFPPMSHTSTNQLINTLGGQCFHGSITHVYREQTTRWRVETQLLVILQDRHILRSLIEIVIK